MVLRMEDIKDLFENYHLNKVKIEAGIATDQLEKAMQYIDKGMAVLDDTSREVLRLVYISKINKTDIARQFNLSRSYLYKLINKALAMLEIQKVHT